MLYRIALSYVLFLSPFFFLFLLFYLVLGLLCKSTTKWMTKKNLVSHSCWGWILKSNCWQAYSASEDNEWIYHHLSLGFNVSDVVVLFRFVSLLSSNQTQGRYFSGKGSTIEPNFTFSIASAVLCIPDCVLKVTVPFCWRMHML